MLHGTLNGTYPIYKAVDAPELLQEAHRRYPNATFIWRRYYSSQEQSARLQQMESDIPGAYNRWFAENEGFLKAMPYAHHESYNEVMSDAYIAFEKYRVEQLASKGYKACVLNISTGTSSKELWAKAKGLIDAVNRYGGIVGEHCYAQGVMSANCNDSYWMQNGQWSGGELLPTVIEVDKCHTALRILQSKKHLTVQGQGNTVLVATELGLDALIGENNGIYAPLGIRTRGWRTCWDVWQRMGWLQGTDPTTFYKKQLDWWAKATGHLGVVYTNGNGGADGWNDFDVSGVM